MVWFFFQFVGSLSGQHLLHSSIVNNSIEWPTESWISDELELITIKNDFYAYWSWIFCGSNEYMKSHSLVIRNRIEILQKKTLISRSRWMMSFFLALAEQSCGVFLFQLIHSVYFYGVSLLRWALLKPHSIRIKCHCQNIRLSVWRKQQIQVLVWINKPKKH